MKIYNDFVTEVLSGPYLKKHQLEESQIEGIVNQRL